jgi:hypothetical protein
MSNELWCSFDEAKSLYALIWAKTDDTVWNNTDETWDTYTDADIDKYDIPLTNHVDSDYHSADFPAAITTAGVYRIQYMWQVGGSIDADADRAVFQGELYWNGSAEYDMYEQYLAAHRVVNQYDERDTGGGTGGTGSEEIEVVIDP